MKSSTLRALLVVAAAVPAATAQNLLVELCFDRTEVMVGETVEATLVATFWNGGWEPYFSTISANLIADDPELGLASTMSGLDWANPLLGAIRAGTPEGASLLGLYAAQQSLFGPVDMSNPFVIGRFTITGLAPGSLAYSASVANSASAAFGFWYNCGPLDCRPSTAFESQTLVIRPVPAPASIGLLGLVTLMGRWRRGAV